MTRKIFKYILRDTNGKITTHRDPRWLCVKEQGQYTVVYVSVDESEPEIEYKYILVPTGGEEPNETDMFYLGTAMLFDGNYVLHVYVSLKEATI